MGRKITDTLCEIVDELCKAGHKYKEIAQMTGLTLEQVAYIRGGRRTPSGAHHHNSANAQRPEQRSDRITKAKREPTRHAPKVEQRKPYTAPVLPDSGFIRPPSLARLMAGR